MSLIEGYFTCDNCYAVYLGNNNGVTQKLLPSTATDFGIVNYPASQIWDGEIVSFNAASGDWLYIIAWSDCQVYQGLLGTFKGAGIINIGDAGWQVLPTKSKVDPYNDMTKFPKPAGINALISSAMPSDWKIPTIGPSYTDTEDLYNSPGTNLSPAFRTWLQNASAVPHWVWFDSGLDTTIGKPFKGFDHDEFLIFRFPLQLIIGIKSCCDEFIELRYDEESSIRRKFNHLKSSNTCQDYPDKPRPSQIDCTSLKIPSIKPCFYLHWGDSSQDILETEDFEVLILSVCNPYRNVNFKNILISKITVFHDNGTSVELLPDGTPSVMIVPSKLICVCCINPCSCSHIELSLKTNSAIAGKYKIKITYCVEEVTLLSNYSNEVEFDVNLITS